MLVKFCIICVFSLRNLTHNPVQTGLWKTLLTCILAGVICGCGGGGFFLELRVSSFPDRFPHYAWTAASSTHSDFVGSRAYVFRCNLPLALLAEWPGSLMCHCGNMGMEWTPNKSQDTKLTLEKKILPPLLPRFELATFQPWDWYSYQQAITALSFMAI